MISVVIPAYNAEETIERALESVLGQSHQDLEVIVVDDGSRDGTAEIVQFHERKDPRVRLLRAEHGGPGAARNAGIAAATGEWLAFLDADDEYAPRTFETLLKKIGTREVGLVIFSIDVIRAYIYTWSAQLPALKDAYFEGDGERAESFIREYFEQKRMLVYSQSNKLYRASVLEQHGIRFAEDVSFGEDRLFNYAYLRHAGSVLTVSKRFLRYHHGKPGRLSNGPAQDEISTLRALSDAKLELFRDYGYSESDLEDFRRHEAKQFLDDAVRALIQRERIGGAALVKEGARDLLAAQPSPYHFTPEAAVSRRVRLMQFALRSRQPGGVAALTSVLRRSEDRRVLRTRRAEIDREKEHEKLGLTTATRRERARYFFLSDYEYFLDRVNPESERYLLQDKGILLRRLRNSPERDFLRRDWLDLRRASFPEFEAFLGRNKRIVAKLFNGRWSAGTEVIDAASPDIDPAALFAGLIERKQYVLEAYLPQHPDVAKFYDGALTSLRVHTFNLGGRVQTLLPWVLKLGSHGSATSNQWAIQSFVDPATGVITSGGMFFGGSYKREDEVYDAHPDSGVPFRGTTIPYAEETIRLVSETARLVPELRFVGWDVALTPDGPAIIEGNAASLFIYGWQEMARRMLGQGGMRAELDAALVAFERFERRQRKAESKRMPGGRPR